MPWRPARDGLLAACLALAACGGTAKNTQNISFFLPPSITPVQPVDRQNFALTFNIENDDEQPSTISNVQWTVSRNGIANVYTGTIGQLVSHQPIPVVITDNEPPGTYFYTITLDPNNLIPEVDKTDNQTTINLTVVPLSVF